MFAGCMTKFKKHHYYFSKILKFKNYKNSINGDETYVVCWMHDQKNLNHFYYSKMAKFTNIKFPQMER
jgi:hypothetical protein